MPGDGFVTRGLDSPNFLQDPTMVLAIDAAFSTPNETLRPSTFECSTGTCTWPIYTTLGVCQQCQDVSFRLEYVEKGDRNLTRPQWGAGAQGASGYRLEDIFLIGTLPTDGQNGNGTVTSLSLIPVETFNIPIFPGPFVDSTAFKNATLPIADFYVAYTRGGFAAALKNDTPSLVECLLTWCAKAIEAKSMNGTLYETVVNTTTIQAESADAYGYPPVTAEFGPNATLRIANGTTQLLRDRIIANLPRYFNQDPAYDFVPLPGIWDFLDTPPYDFGTYLSNVTQAISNNLKSRSLGTRPVEGTAWSSERFVQIQWAWITLPVTSLVCSFILICATIVQGRSSKTLVWKSSALATLLHGLSEDTRALIDPSLSLSQIEATSEELRVCLSTEGQNARLVAVDDRRAGEPQSSIRLRGRVS
jgi:hypothetical protein